MAEESEVEALVSALIGEQLDRASTQRERLSTALDAVEEATRMARNLTQAAGTAAEQAAYREVLRELARAQQVSSDAVTGLAVYLIQQHGMTTREAARIAGVSQTTVFRWTQKS